MKKLILTIVICLVALAGKAQAPTDSVGVYAVQESGVSPIDLLNYKNVKASVGFASVKTKLEYKGKTSPHHFKGTAKLRIYFGSQTSPSPSWMRMFSPQLSIDEIGIGKFEVKKDSRLLTTMSAKPFRANAGAKETKDVKCQIAEIRPGVYELTISGKPGEYCLMNMLMSGSGYNGVFDFTIEKP